MNHGGGTANFEADVARRDVASLLNPQGRAPLLLVCEHASNYIPPQFDGLGLSADEQLSHVAWDPGAGAVAREMSALLDAPLLESGVSRLVYDCNRPPEAPGAMLARSETVAVAGNVGLSAADRAARAHDFYTPFHDLLTHAIAVAPVPPVLVTVHSFTPLYFGKRRDVGLGILHDADTRLADRMLSHAADHLDIRVARNQPYGPEDGVTHTLREHGLRHGLLNVMLEVRNDLITTDEAQRRVALALSKILSAALSELGITTAVRDR